VANQNNAKVSYLTNDHLGSPRAITDSLGKVTSRRDFLPFGEEIYSIQRTTTLGYSDDAVRQKFTGYERDIETDEDFAEARYYNYKVGRFNSVDPENAGVEIVKPQSWNAYVYSLNNPLSFVDPDGLKPVWLQRLDSNGDLAEILKADDEDEEFQDLLNGGWKLVQFNDSGEFQYPANFLGQIRYVILTSNGKWRWGDYYQQPESEDTTAGFVTNVPTTTPPQTVPPETLPSGPSTSPRGPTAPTLPPANPTSATNWLLRILRILGVP
jgi:RHS repeat-associated protein